MCELLFYVTAHAFSHQSAPASRENHKARPRGFPVVSLMLLKKREDSCDPWFKTTRSVPVVSVPVVSGEGL